MVRRLVFAALFVSGCGLSAASASPVTLTAASATLTGVDVLGGAFSAQRAGRPSREAGVIGSFLRVQEYNASAGTPLDDEGGQLTRVLGLGELPMPELAGIEDRQFLLDVSQLDKEGLLLLGQTRIFPSTGDGGDDAPIPPAGSDAPSPGFAGAGWIESFRLDNAVSADELLLDDGLNPGGSGGGMFLAVANSLFAAGYSNAILYSQFGPFTGATPVEGGFKEWVDLKPPAPPCIDCEPSQETSDATSEAGSLILLGAGLLLGAVALGDRRQHRRRRHYRRRSFRR